LRKMKRKCDMVGREGFEPPKAEANRFHVILQFPASVDYIFTMIRLCGISMPHKRTFRYSGI
jgi:hypothetical protein